MNREQKQKTDDLNLTERIKEYKKECRSLLKEEISAEWGKKIALGEVFLDGYWIPKELVPRIQKGVADKGRIIFFETFLLISGVIACNLLVWFAFTKFLLP